MSLKPMGIPPVPPETARVARAASDVGRSQHREAARVDEIPCVIKQDARRDQHVLEGAVLVT